VAASPEEERIVKVVVVTGIFPPDVGGPATHASDLVVELTRRGHDATVLTLTDGPTSQVDRDVVRFPRRWSWPRRTAAAIVWLVRHRRRYDVVYATGTGLIAVLGAHLARRRVVLKIVGDPAWERGVRRGLTAEGFDDFQDSHAAGPRLRAMQAMRDWTVRHADRLVTPSAYLAEVVERWSGRTGDVTVIPNGVRAAPRHTSPAGAGPLHLIWVGRLVGHKRVDMLVDAVAATPDVSLEIVGDGPEHAHIEECIRQREAGDRVALQSALPHDAVLERIASAHAFVSASSYEGLPHVVIEALACGTPVVAVGAGGVVETIEHEVDGLIVDGDGPDPLAAAIRRLRDDEGLRARLAEGAGRTGSQWQFGRTADQIERLLLGLVGDRPRAVFVGRTRIPHPVPDDLRKKFALHARYLDCTMIAGGNQAVERSSGVRIIRFPPLRPAPLGSGVFYVAAPALAVFLAAGRKPAAVVCQSPFEGLGAVVVSRMVPARWRPSVQIELHGDWKTAARLYGAPLRQRIAPAADRFAEWALRRADRVRPVSELLADRAREAGYRGPLDRFITFSDYGLFFDGPLKQPPDKPLALFVGVLERYKAVDILIDAWPAVVAEVPDATLMIVGRGSLGENLVGAVERQDMPGVSFLEPVGRAELREMIDDSTLLVLPSRSEGLARIVVETMARARPVVASRVGGIEEVLVDGVNGRLVPAEDVVALSDALIELLGSLSTAEEMGHEARRIAEERNPLVEYEDGIRRLSEWIGRAGCGDPTSREADGQDVS
jgi:glycosyltransferase involved in cell wall biosynthesis